MSRPEAREADGAFVEEFRRVVEADFAEARTGLRRYVARAVVFVVGGTVAALILDRVIGGDAGAGLSGVAVALAGGSLVKVRAARKRAGERLADARDPRLVGLLAGYAFARRKVVREGARTGLQLALRAARPCDAALISGGEMASLVRLLETEGESEYVLDLLKAFPFIGDGRALPAVKALASGELLSFEQAAWSRPTRDRVRHAALECLPFLEQRAEEDRQRATLLRAAQAPAGQDALLRPAANSGAVEAEAEQLLRPSREE